MQRATVGRRRQMKGAAFGAEATKVRGVIGLTAHSGDFCAVGGCQYAAADTAVRAGGFYFTHEAFAWPVGAVLLRFLDDTSIAVKPLPQITLVHHA